MPKVLITDDEQMFQAGMKELLEKHGYEVLCASDGAEALALLCFEGPDVVVLDMVMPVLSGWGVLCTLHKLKLKLRAKIIVTSGWVVLPDQLPSPYVHAVVPKPTSFAKLVECIERVLNGTGTSSR